MPGGSYIPRLLESPVSALTGKCASDESRCQPAGEQRPQWPDKAGWRRSAVSGAAARDRSAPSAAETGTTPAEAALPASGLLRRRDQEARRGAAASNGPAGSAPTGSAASRARRPSSCSRRRSQFWPGLADGARPSPAQTARRCPLTDPLDES